MRKCATMVTSFPVRQQQPRRRRRRKTNTTRQARLRPISLSAGGRENASCRSATETSRRKRRAHHHQSCSPTFCEIHAERERERDLTVTPGSKRATTASQFRQLLPRSISRRKRAARSPTPTAGSKRRRPTNNLIQTTLPNGKVVCIKLLAATVQPLHLALGIDRIHN